MGQVQRVAVHHVVHISMLGSKYCNGSDSPWALSVGCAVYRLIWRETSSAFNYVEAHGDEGYN